MKRRIITHCHVMHDNKKACAACKETHTEAYHLRFKVVNPPSIYYMSVSLCTLTCLASYVKSMNIK